MPRSAAVIAAVRWITAGLMNAAGLIGAIATPPAPRRGRRSIGLRSRTAVATCGSAISAAGSATASESSGADHLGHALEGAAGDHVRGPRHPGRLAGDRDRHVDVLELGLPALARGLGRELHGEVGRQRLEAADLDDLHPGLGRARRRTRR